jgi:hypothetical protein
MAEERASPSFFSKFAALVDAGILKLLKPAELKLLFALVRFADFDTGACHPSRETLRVLTGCCRDTFAAALKELKRRGLLQYKRGSKRVHFKYQYTLTCFCPGNLDQSKGDAFVRELPTKAEDEKPGPDLLSSENHRIAFVRELPAINRMNRKKEREEESPPPSSQNEKDKTKEAQKIVSEVSGSLLRIPRTPVSPFFEKGHRKRVDTGEKAFGEQMKKILHPEEVGGKPT